MCGICRTTVLLLAAALVSASGLSASANTITGKVVGTAGKPLAGATVMISTAAPRVGVSVYCPSCYADCGKKAVTDSEGRFKLEGLDPSLTFRLVAAADRHRAGRSAQVDPLADKPKLWLDALPEILPPENVVHGRVIDQDGKPVAGAMVSPEGCKQGERRWWGAVDDADAFAITDDKGQFMITAASAADAYDLLVRSPRHAAKSFALVPTGNESQDLAVELGTLVRGRLVANGKPVAGAKLGLVQLDRSSESFLGEHEIGTRDDGSFEFSYVPDSDLYYIYTKMTDVGRSGALPLRRVTIADAEPTVEMGDLELGPAVALAGRIELTDGKPVPGPLQLLVSREGAWDSQKAMVEGDGKFSFENVPVNEPLTFVARVPGYRLSDRTRFQQIRENSIAMYVEAPRDDIVIYYEPTGDAQR
jgi:uncharacterized GH25 family protein